MLPSLSLPPVLSCFGTNPIQAARLRPYEKAFQSPTSATSGGADRADAGDLHQPPARLTGAMLGYDALVDGCYLGADDAILPASSKLSNENADPNSGIVKEPDDAGPPISRNTDNRNRYNFNCGPWQHLPDLTDADRRPSRLLPWCHRPGCLNRRHRRSSCAPRRILPPAYRRGRRCRCHRDLRCRPHCRCG